uniref:WWE domain-containing protein n=1 Tax=Alexandrium andersonii TaxID=327968 RepID=A0A7S2BPV5_9DINO|mmetsp:Transcript_2859/g.6474  ORF Transcript_2859/g.6474 Transcript_2859/m.6474 type:complete len:237 (+) Transcript_2859:70-780(+)
MASFQVKLGGEWKNYDKDEDKILKRAYLAGFPRAMYALRGQNYEVDFKRMAQKNQGSGKQRDIRAPHKWKAPEKPITTAGPTFCITVPPGAPGTTIQVPHPGDKTQMIAVNVPATAKVGQAMLVPIPTGPPAALAPQDIQGEYTPQEPTDEKEKKKWSTGAKVAAATGGVLVVGGLAVGGAVLGEHIAEEGWDATMAELGDVATSAGEGIADGAEAAVDWVGDAADSAGDFIMDLF